MLVNIKTNYDIYIIFSDSFSTSIEIKIILPGFRTLCKLYHILCVPSESNH